MNTVVLKNKNGSPLFENRFHSIKKCLESAVAQGIVLDGIALPHANLTGANLDGARMAGADLSGANLTGANLSESRLDGADFSGAALYNACLCEASLRGCNFRDAAFGATDIAGADLSESVFSTLSAFLLNFTDCTAMKDCRFEDPAGISCPISHPPVVILGPPRPVFILDRHIKTGALPPLTHAQWQNTAPCASNQPLHTLGGVHSPGGRSETRNK